MSENYKIETYERFLGEVKQSDGTHWEKIQKRTATLFQVLMDEDLKELVFVLRNYPQYIESVCEHFRYLYNYSGKVANIYAASELLNISQEYHQKQFVRNLLRKLQRLDDFDIKDIKLFLDNLVLNQEKINPIILYHYKLHILDLIENNSYHKLQTIIIEKSLNKLICDDSFDFSAADRDAALDIPYMQ